MHSTRVSTVIGPDDPIQVNTLPSVGASIWIGDLSLLFPGADALKALCDFADSLQRTAHAAALDGEAVTA